MALAPLGDSWHLSGDLRVMGSNPSWNFRQSLPPTG